MHFTDMTYMTTCTDMLIYPILCNKSMHVATHKSHVISEWRTKQWQRAKTLGSTSITHWSHMKMPDQSLMDVFAIRVVMHGLPQQQSTFLTLLTHVYTQDPNFVITLPAEVLVHNGAQPSTGTEITTKLNTFQSLCSYLNIWMHFTG